MKNLLVVRILAFIVALIVIIVILTVIPNLSQLWGTFLKHWDYFLVAGLGAAVWEIISKIFRKKG